MCEINLLRLRVSVFIRAIFAIASSIFLAGCMLPGGQSGDEWQRKVRENPSADTAAELPLSDKAISIDEKAMVDDYVGYALRNNPGLKAIFQRWQAAIERIPQARSLADPALTYEYSLTQKDFAHRVAITQMIPGIGKLDFRKRKALAEAAAALQEFETAKLTLYSEVVTAFYEYDFLRRATATREENARLLADLENVIQAKYKAGSAGFADLIKVQMELENLKNELATLHDERAARSAKLASLLNLPPDRILPWPATPQPAPDLQNEDDLLEILRSGNPELKSLRAMVQREEAAVGLARRNRYPDFMVGAALMVMPDMEGRSDQSEASLMAGITLPLWQGKYAAEIREAKAMLASAVAQQENAAKRLEAELKMAVFNAKDAERRARLFRESLVPKAEQAYAVAQQEYAAGKADFMTLIDAQRNLLEFKLLYERAVTDREIALAEIGRYLGQYGRTPTVEQRQEEGKAK